MRRSIASAFRRGESLFCSKLIYSALYFSGTTPGLSSKGILIDTPVSGGLRHLSRANSDRTETMFPPADSPWIIKPLEGSEPRSAALVAI